MLSIVIQRGMREFRTYSKTCRNVANWHSCNELAGKTYKTGLTEKGIQNPPFALGPWWISAVYLCIYRNLTVYSIYGYNHTNTQHNHHFLDYRKGITQLPSGPSWISAVYHCMHCICIGICMCISQGYKHTTILFHLIRNYIGASGPWISAVYHCMYRNLTVYIIWIQTWVHYLQTVRHTAILFHLILESVPQVFLITLVIGYTVLLSYRIISFINNFCRKLMNKRYCEITSILARLLITRCEIEGGCIQDLSSVQRIMTA